MLFLGKQFFLIFLIFFLAGCSFKNNYIFPSNKPQKVNDSTSMHKATMRPYKIAGKTYYPTRVSVGDKYTGMASWYGKDFHGKKTSNGEVYNMNSMTAAHKTLPMNTLVKVTNLKNSKQVVVRVNDRGPFVAGRIIDLSRSAAGKIDMIKTGTAPVKIEILSFSGQVQAGTKAPISIDGGSFMIQVGSFRKMSGAEIYKKQYNNTNGRYKTTIRTYVLDGYPIYRVFLKGFYSEAEARDFINNNSQFKGSFIVRDSQ